VGPIRILILKLTDRRRRRRRGVYCLEVPRGRTRGGGTLARSVVAQWLAGVGRVGVRVRSEWLEVFPQDAGGGPPRLPPSRRGY